MSDREIEEIEAILNETLHILPDEQNGKWPVLVGVKKAARAIAALRSQDREDGAREMRERAVEACLKEAELSNGQHDYDAGIARGCRDSARLIVALPLSPERTEAPDA